MVDFEKLTKDVVTYSSFSLYSALNIYPEATFLSKTLVMSPAIAMLKDPNSSSGTLALLSAVRNSDTEVSLATVQRQEGILTYEDVLTARNPGLLTQTDVWTVPPGERWILNSWQSSLEGYPTSVSYRAILIDSNRIEVSERTGFIHAQMIPSIAVNQNQTITVTITFLTANALNVRNGIGFYKVSL